GPVPSIDQPRCHRRHHQKTQRHQRYAEQRFSELRHTKCVFHKNSYQRLAIDPEREPEEAAPRGPAVAAEVIKCLSHALAEALEERPGIQPQQLRINPPVAVSAHAPTVLPRRPPRRDTDPVPLPGRPAPRL